MPMSTQYPLQIPDELMGEIESTATRVHLSKAEVMRQSIKLGLPKLRQQLSGPDRVTNVDPLPESVMHRLYEERQDDDASIRKFIAGQPKGEVD